MTNQDILQIAMQQSAYDINCTSADFLRDTNVLVDAHIGSRARKYYREPVACNLVSYGSNIVASVKPAYREIVAECLKRFDFYHCFETPNIHWLEDRLRPLGQSICFMAEYYLPDLTGMTRRSCGYELRMLIHEDFADLYTEDWSNALCEDRRELDVLGIGAYDNGCLVGLAGCSADCEEMWQIGVDVLPRYRKQGIAAALVSNLAAEILARGKVPFYCSAWSNLRSARTAIKCGFVPAWVELTVKPAQLVEEMNGGKDYELSNDSID